MTKRKKPILAVLSLFLPLALMLSGCNNTQNDPIDPWDNLGGGGTGTDITDTNGDDVDKYLPSTDPGETDYPNGTNEDGSINISLDGLETTPSGTGYTYKNHVLSISSAGTYVLSGILNGTVDVAKNIAGDVRVVLNGATITADSTQYCAGIVFRKPSGSYGRILTVASGTINTVSDSVGDNEVTNADADTAVIQAKSCSLVINGGGTLNLEAKGNEVTGIKVKEILTIYDTTINISNGNTNSLNNGIKSGSQLYALNSKIAVNNAQNDGIKTDMTPSTVEEAVLYAGSKDYGYIYIEKSDIEITSVDDGIAAENCLYIKNDTTNTIEITTNNGAPTNVTESSSDKADGKAIKTGGITYTDESGKETDYAASYEDNYALVITGGTFKINSNDDAITSKGNLLITGGTFNISSGDDGIHAEYANVISGGDITINKCYEGIEGSTVEISGGSINLTSTDDGINGANPDLKETHYILISGGDIFVNAQGDGIDANGTIKITGGNVTVFGPTASMNAALDADTGVIIDGGTVCAVGAAGMVERPSTNSKSCYISLTLPSTAAANTPITLKNSSESTVFSITPTKTYQSVILSLDEFEIGSTYALTVGSNSYTANFTTSAVALGSSSSGIGGGHGPRPISVI